MAGLLVTVAAACGGSIDHSAVIDDTVVLEDAAADARTAFNVCSALRETVNGIVDAVNASVAGVNAIAPVDRTRAFLDGAAAIDAELTAWAVRIDDLSLPPGDEGRELRRQLEAGLADGRRELDEERDELQASESAVPDEQVAGAVGAWFNSVEKVMSSLEPEIHRFERHGFKQAFLEEPTCRHVVQPFVND
jgi:hypothetical protein